MAAGLDTGLQCVHYLSRRVTATTPFIGVGVLIGELPTTALIQSVSILVTGVWTGAAMLISQNPNVIGAAAFATAALNALGSVTAVPQTDPVTDYLRTGKLYAAIGAVPGGSGIIQIRYFPRTDPQGFG